VARISAYGTYSERKRFPAGNEGRCINLHLVTRVLPETGRSIPEQGEAEVKLRGGLKGCCGQAFL
jgi:hypothetical protein